MKIARLLGRIGRVMITAGALILAFVAYQLWGTGIATARAQGDLETAFAQLISSTTTNFPEPAFWVKEHLQTDHRPWCSGMLPAESSS